MKLIRRYNVALDAWEEGYYKGSRFYIVNLIRI